MSAIGSSAVLPGIILICHCRNFYDHIRSGATEIETMLQVGSGVNVVAESDSLTIFAPENDAFKGTDLTQNPDKLNRVMHTYKDQ